MHDLFEPISRHERQAKQWEDKAKEIIKVAELKGWDVTREINL